MAIEFPLSGYYIRAMEIVIIEASPELSRLSQKIFKRNSSRDKEILHSAIKAILVPKSGHSAYGS